MKKIFILIGFIFFAVGCSNSVAQQPTTPTSQSVTSALDQSAQIAELQKEVDQLKNQKTQVIIKQQSPAQPDLSSIIKEWRLKIAIIACKWNYTDPSQDYTAYGSGLLTKDNFGNIYVYTNRHVISDSQGSVASSCGINITGDSNIYQFNKNPNEGLNSAPVDRATDIGQSFYVSNDSDFTQIRIYSPDDYTKNSAATLKSCPSSPADGDSVVILGYPAIGSQTDITATEGIISGKDGNYFITSAKVEHGDSGGAAILENGDCYLGLPTYAITGSVESLARILDIKTVLSK